jgi:hypothetical protein
MMGGGKLARVASGSYSLKPATAVTRATAYAPQGCSISGCRKGEDFSSLPGGLERRSGPARYRRRARTEQALIDGLGPLGLTPQRRCNAARLSRTGFRNAQRRGVRFDAYGGS